MLRVTAFDAASARIVLPGQVSAELLGIEGYTGAMGDTDTNIAVTSTLSQAEIVSTLPLLPAQDCLKIICRTPLP